MATVHDDDYDDDAFDNAEHDEQAIRRHMPRREDMDSSDEPGVDACPYCNKMVSEDAEQCHHCGNYISREDAPSRVPVWVFVLAVLALAMFLWRML